MPPNQLETYVFCLDTWGDARCTKIDFKAYVSKCVVQPASCGGWSDGTFASCHVPMILAGPGLILAAAEPISKPQVRKDGIFWEMCIMYSFPALPYLKRITFKAWPEGFYARMVLHRLGLFKVRLWLQAPTRVCQTKIIRFKRT